MFFTLTLVLIGFMFKKLRKSRTPEPLKEPLVEKSRPTPPPLPKGPPKAPPPKAPTPRKPLVKPKKAMKRLFWSSFVLSDQQLSPRRSVWGAIDGEVESLTVDEEELERMFCGKGAATNHSASSSGRSSTPSNVRPSAIKVFDEKRRWKYCVMRASLPKLDELESGVFEMDDMILNRDQVDLLTLNVPTQEDLELVWNAVVDIPEEEQQLRLDSAEQFVLCMGKVPDFNLRLQLWAFENSFAERCDTFTVGADDLLSACMVVQTSERLKRLLALALKVGNYLNAGTARGRADGFSLEALVQMRTVKASAALEGSNSAANEQTLIDFFVHETVRNRGISDLEELLAQGAEAEIIHRASRLKTTDLREELAQYRAQAEDLKQKAAEHVNDQAILARGERVGARCQELECLRARFETADAEYKTVCNWFHVQDAKHTKAPEEFFGAWHTFLSDIRKSFEKMDGENKKNRRNSFGSAWTT